MGVKLRSARERIRNHSPAAFAGWFVTHSVRQIPPPASRALPFKQQRDYFSSCWLWLFFTAETAALRSAPLHCLLSCAATEPQRFCFDFLALACFLCSPPPPPLPSLLFCSFLLPSWPCPRRPAPLGSGGLFSLLVDLIRRYSQRVAQSSQHSVNIHRLHTCTLKPWSLPLLCATAPCLHKYICAQRAATECIFSEFRCDVPVWFVISPLDEIFAS